MAGLIVFDPDNEEVGLSTGDDIAVNSYLDIQSDTLYFTDGLNIYEWEGEETGLRQTYIWRSGEIRMPNPINMGAALVEAELYTETVGGGGGDLLFGDVLFLAEFEGSNGVTAYTELGQYALAATFNGATQISTTSPLFDTSSADLGSGAVSEYIGFQIDAGDFPDWGGEDRILTAEVAFRMDNALHSSGTKDILLIGSSDDQVFRLGVYRSGGQTRLRAGFVNSGGLTPVITLNVDTDYVVVVESDTTAGAGLGTERVWFGPKGGSLTLIDTTTSITAKDIALFSRDIRMGGNAGLFGTDAHIDHVRITNSLTGRYSGDPITLEDPFPTFQANAPYEITFRLYADGVLKHTQIVTDDEPFRLPGGYLSNIYSVEIESAMPVTRVSVAENIFELSEG